MLDKLIGGIAEFGNGYGHKNYRTGGGYGYEEHKEFVSHVETGGGYSNRQASYDRMKLPANHGRPPMAHMPVCDEDDSDVEEFFESSRSHHTTKLPHHSIPPHMKHGDAYHGGHGMQHHGGHGMQHHGGHGMQHHGGHGMQHHGGHEMQHHGGHGLQHHAEHGMQHHGGHGVQHHGGHGMQHHGGHGVQHHDMHGMQHQGGHGMKHQDRLMAPHVPPHHVYINPNHASGEGRAVVMKTTENWRVSNSNGRKIGWGSKGL